MSEEVSTLPPGVCMWQSHAMQPTQATWHAQLLYLAMSSLAMQRCERGHRKCGRRRSPWGGYPYLERHEPDEHWASSVDDGCQGCHTEGSGQRAPADGAAQDQGQPGQAGDGADEGLDMHHGKAAAAGGKGDIRDGEALGGQSTGSALASLMGKCYYQVD